MKIGIVGKPSSGKTTFLNAACLTQAETAAYPFTTINPNLGTAWFRTQCPHIEFKKAECSPKNGRCFAGIRLVPIQLVDVAGLVPGAHLGKGKGNQFLNDLVDADALIHVVDASGRTNEEGNPVNEYNPRKDVEWLEEEISEWIYGILHKDWNVVERKIRLKTSKINEVIWERLSGLKVSRQDVENAMRKINPEEDLKGFAREIRAQSKPILVALNKVDTESGKANAKGMDGIPCSAASEFALRRAEEAGLIKYAPGGKEFDIMSELSPEQEKALKNIDEKVLKPFGNTGVQQAISKTVTDLLGMIVVFPVEDESKLADKKGNVLPDAFLMKSGSTALDLAFKVHSDIGKKFKGAVDCRTKKRVGKDYILQNNDVLRVLT